MDTDPIEFRRIVTAFAKEHLDTAPFDLLDQLRSVVVALDEWGVPIVAPPVPVKVDPVAEAQRPAQVPLAVTPGPNGIPNVAAKTPEAEPVARTLRTILDLIAQKQLGSMAQAALEFAAHIESLELQAADLRRQLAERQR